MGGDVMLSLHSRIETLWATADEMGSNDPRSSPQLKSIGCQQLIERDKITSVQCSQSYSGTRNK